MSLVKVRRAAQITLPAEVREKLNVKEGDYLEAEVREGVLMLKPVAVLDRASAWKGIREAQESVRYIGPEPRPSPEEEEWIYQTVREHRESRG